MRYYKLTVTPPSGAPLVLAESHPNGSFDPGALDVQFDVIVTNMVVAESRQYMRVYGVPLALLSQTTNMAPSTPGGIGWGVSLEGGMLGPPLVGTARHGTIAIGRVLTAYGNWIGTEMTLDIFISAPYSTSRDPHTFLFTWSPGQSLADALRTTLLNAYAGTGYGVSADIGQYETTHVVTHVCTHLQGLARFVNAITSSATLPGGIGGVIIGYSAGQILAYDLSISATSVIALRYEDLVGQPMWVDVNHMQITLVMRNDIQQASVVSLPSAITDQPGLTIQTPKSFPNFTNNYAPAFTGDFLVTSVRHLGNFRSTDSTQWVTIINCVPMAVTNA